MTRPEFAHTLDPALVAQRLIREFAGQVVWYLEHFSDIVTENDALSANVTVEGLNLLAREGERRAEEFTEHAKAVAGQVERAFEAAEKQPTKPNPHATNLSLPAAAQWLVNVLESEVDDELGASEEVQAIYAVKEALRREIA